MSGSEDTAVRPDVDAVVVGAGFSGLYLLHRLRNELGLSVAVLEAGDGIGGTWYWNRYPGAKSDSDSYIYNYFFDPELTQDWTWTERYPGQKEILSYLDHVADRFDLRGDITLGTRVLEATFDEAANLWTVRTDTGVSTTARFVISAVGSLSATFVPDFPGVEEFEGISHHTSRWPHEGVDFTGLRVGVIGTGASAVQAIPLIAEQAAELTVFQRTANYILPARNGPVDPALTASRKAEAADIRDRLRQTFGGFEHYFLEQGALQDTPEQREIEFRKRWDAGGFGLWVGCYLDIFFDEAANRTVRDFLDARIRETVEDPETAELLVPTTYHFGTKRHPLDSGYFETFNRPNVKLVDVRAAPILEITAKGVRTAAEQYELDAIVYATGFDALTGPLNNIDIRGRGGVLLREKWAEGPVTYLGVASADFPNLFLMTGPGSPSVMANMPGAIEQHVEFISGIVEHMRDHGLATVEPAPQAEQEWTAHVQEVAGASLFVKTDSWYMGANIPGKPRTILPYLGGFGTYVAKCAEVVEQDYPGFAFSDGS